MYRTVNCRLWDHSGTSVSNLGKDWKDELTDEELQSLQYEVSLNEAHEEIRHVLDSEIAKNGGKLTPQQMYEAVKRYETYVAHNKRLKGKGASLSASQLKAADHTLGYKPRFHKTTAFAAIIPETEDDGPGHHESSPQEEADTYGNESSQEDDEGLFIPSYLEEAPPDDPVLQVKMAHAMQAQKVEMQRCFTCNQQGHLQRDHWKYEEKKQEWAPAAEGASPKQVSSREGEDKTPSVGPRHVSNKSSKVKRAPYLNLDAFCRFIGPKNLGKALIDDELVSCLLDNGAQLNFITPAYAQEQGMDIMSLDYLAEEIGGSIPLIRGLGGISVEPVGFVMMNVKVPGVEGYDEEAGVIWPSNNPWCNAVVLVRKKDGSLRFCIDFRKLNPLTVKDSHPLPHICETLESLAGAAHYLTFNMNSGFWQVPMDEESKQYTAFTLGSMGLYECESMPFGLCNALPTFQRLMQNCLGELNLTYCLIYLDDVIVFSDMPKCNVFKSEINYLAHHVSQKGVLPSKKNLESIAQCPPPDTYTKVKSFMGLVGHYRCFIKSFAKIAAPLYDLTSGDNKDKKSEHVDLSPEAREAFDCLKAACL